jgi:hypothetical protein
MMFDEDVWIAIAITFGGGLVIIQIINFCSDKIQDIVFGEGVRRVFLTFSFLIRFNLNKCTFSLNRSPTINFFGIIFGIGQQKLPRKSFPRFILMMFIILCLILRTCHQSLLYDLMQKDLRRAELKTIEEAIAKGYTFYMRTPTVYRFKQTEHVEG